MARIYKTTLRMSAFERDLIGKEAARAGLGISQFIRLTAVAHAAYLEGAAGGTPLRDIAAIVERLRQPS